MTDPDEHDQILIEENIKRTKRRSIAIGISLSVLVIFFYFITIFKVGPGIIVR